VDAITSEMSMTDNDAAKLQRAIEEIEYVSETRAAQERIERRLLAMRVPPLLRGGGFKVARQAWFLLSRVEFLLARLMADNDVGPDELRALHSAIADLLDGSKPENTE
jgi:hypothetical protein